MSDYYNPAESFYAPTPAAAVAATTKPKSSGATLWKVLLVVGGIALLVVLLVLLFRWLSDQSKKRLAELGVGVAAAAAGTALEAVKSSLSRRAAAGAPVTPLTRAASSLFGAPATPSSGAPTARDIVAQIVRDRQALPSANGGGVASSASGRQAVEQFVRDRFGIAPLEAPQAGDMRRLADGPTGGGIMNTPEARDKKWDPDRMMPRASAPSNRPAGSLADRYGPSTAELAVYLPDHAEILDANRHQQQSAGIRRSAPASAPSGRFA